MRYLEGKIELFDISTSGFDRRVKERERERELIDFMFQFI